jgi:hypothetical protein
VSQLFCLFISSLQQLNCPVTSHKRLTQQKKQRERERKELDALGRRQLANVRVVQRNVVYVVGIGPQFAKEEVCPPSYSAPATWLLINFPSSSFPPCARMNTLGSMGRSPSCCSSRERLPVVEVLSLVSISHIIAEKMPHVPSQLSMVQHPQEVVVT